MERRRREGDGEKDVPDFSSSARSSAEAGVCNPDHKSLNSTLSRQPSTKRKRSEKQTFINLRNLADLIQEHRFHLPLPGASEGIPIRSRDEDFSVLL